MKNDLNGLTLPTCEIMVNGQKRKLYGKKKNKVYLYNGDNFQLNVFNPLQERIGISLKVNGTNVDDDLLVISPGQAIIIERYIGTNRKLTFSAYEIDTTNMSEEKITMAKKAIEKNGVLEVIFWNEKIKLPIITTATTITTNYYTDNFDFTYNRTFTNTPVLNEDLFTNQSISGIIGIQGPAGATGISGTNLIGSCNSTSTKSMEFNTANFLGDIQPEPSKIETGRIEKGEASKQYFTKIDFEVGEQFYKIKFKLIPFSLKPVKKKLYNSTIIKQIVEGTQTAYKSESAVREYCKCGYRISRGKGVWKNCPMCGRKIKEETIGR